ncbi:hypothetical protein M0R45_010526 [Rubus argutus]|uniref:Uncharacterized protein n=1 Tax=Rubus argutus TaxID=59490 RepID=A0AAW1Y7B3_RUBAR
MQRTFCSECTCGETKIISLARKAGRVHNPRSIGEYGLNLDSQGLFNPTGISSDSVLNSLVTQSQQKTFFNTTYSQSSKCHNGSLLGQRGDLPIIECNSCVSQILPLASKSVEKLLEFNSKGAICSMKLQLPTEFFGRLISQGFQRSEAWIC